MRFIVDAGNAPSYACLGDILVREEEIRWVTHD